MLNKRGAIMLLNIENLCKKYSSKADYTIKDICIKGNEGEIIGILGHNGAGKSTTIKCATGIHPYDEGLIEICDYDLKKNPLEAKANFGYVSDEYTLFEKMTGMEFVNFMADIFQLGDSIYKQMSSYSHGMKQKISIMGALIHNPKVFILDEPMVGLDPYTANQLKEFFKKYSQEGNLVIFSSHNLDVVEKVCNRVYIIDQGRILEEINIEEFKNEGKDLETYFLSITKRVARV